MANAEVISCTMLVMVVMDRPKTMGMMPTRYIKNDAEKQIQEQQTALDDFADHAKWYVQTREDNVGYSGFWENTERVQNVVAVFPVFFILIAALVCLTTMTRMVREQRVEMGTKKALGYGAFPIMAKFLLFNILCTYPDKSCKCCRNCNPP